MELFFDEFETYVKNKYGEESYLKTLMEETLLPLKKSLERITPKDITESLFCKVDAGKILKGPLKSLGDSITPNKILKPAQISPQAPKQESGLSEKPKEVIVSSFGKDALTSIYAAVGVASKENLKLKNPKQESSGDGGGGGGGIIGALLKGGLVIGGLVALMGGLFTDGKWKGALKIASKALLSLSGLGEGIRKFFGGISEGVGKIAGFFKESKIIKALTKATGIDTLMKNAASGKGIFKFLGKGLKFLKRIPFLGSIIAFAFAYDRFKTGDTVGGILEIASGIANFFPGIGTAISIGIDMVTALKDLATGGSEGAAKMTLGEQGKAMLNIIPKFISENLEKFGIWIKDKTIKGIEKFLEVTSDFVKDLPEKLGEGLVNGIINLNSFVVGKLVDLGQYIKDNGGLAVVATNIMTSIVDLFTNTIGPATWKAVEFIGPMIGKFFKTLWIDIPGDFFKGVWNALDENFDITKHITDFKNTVTEKWEAFTSKLKDGFYKLLNSLDYFNPFSKKDDSVVGSSQSASKTVGKLAAKEKTKNNIISKTETDRAKSIEKSRETAMKDLRASTDNIAKTEDIDRMTQQLVVAINNNSSISAQGSAVVASAVGSGGGGSVTNIVNNTTSDAIKSIRDLGRSRVGG